MSKCSILILTRNVFAGNFRVSIVAMTTISLVAIWALIGAVASAIVCPAENLVPKPGDKHCSSFVSFVFMFLIYESKGYRGLVPDSTFFEMYVALSLY